MFQTNEENNPFSTRIIPSKWKKVYNNRNGIQSMKRELFLDFKDISTLLDMKKSWEGISYAKPLH